ncbi:MAG TPA: hypothetical protein VF433_03485, partial [Cellvibrio sp.]
KMARITSNRHVFHWNGETVTVTRRTVGKGTALRVRVTVVNNRTDAVTRDEYRDYRAGEWSRGESVFAGHVKAFERLIASEARKAWNAS